MKRNFRVLAMAQRGKDPELSLWWHGFSSQPGTVGYRSSVAAAVAHELPYAMEWPKKKKKF